MSSPKPQPVSINSPTNQGEGEHKEEEVNVEHAIEQAKRAFALRKYEQAVEWYGKALEVVTKQSGDDAPQTADLYFSYGRALLENAITQSGVLGKEQQEPNTVEEEPQAGSSDNAPILSFSGDPDEGEEAIDLFASAEKAVVEEEKVTAQAAAEEEEEEEPEDDFNAAWEVLDLARAIYDRQASEEDDDEVRLKLADTYIALGDVSLETEKFDQAIQDYEAGLKLKLNLLPKSSRQIAEAHYKLSMVLDLTSGRLADAIHHAEMALESVEARLAELREGLEGRLPSLPEEAAAPTNPDVKGKGKAMSGAKLVRDDVVQKMSKQKIESEIKELSELRDDLALKVDELKTSPNEALSTSAPALAAQALDRELNAAVKPINLPQAVNDLTAVVKKKKKESPADTNGTKRKAEGETDEANAEKKARLETP